MASRVLCVGRHRYLSEHVARVFNGFGLSTCVAVGLNEAAKADGTFDAILCDHDLLEPLTEDEWRAMPLLATDRLIVYTMNRRFNEVPPLALRGAIKFLYLPLTTRELALAAIS
ncbi:MAG TPA: hypothetical protein VFA43_22730 [Gemmatimonadaceae bacterium]|nr:hypothetical protein [Gemmatimonadaceae bacterium]